MNKLVKNIIISSILMLMLDYIYLSNMSGFFNNLLINIQGSPIKLRVDGAILCYILLVAGLNYFILNNSNLNNKQKIKNAFLLGICIYGVYETTNLAIIQKWDYKAVLIDTTWGGILFALTTYLTLKINN